MAYAEARAKIIEIVEGATPTRKDKGIPGSFKHFPSASRESLPGARGFFIAGGDTIALDMGTRMSSLHYVRGTEIVIAYPEIDPSALDVILAADSVTILERLATTSLWGRPSSTIVTLFEGGIRIPTTVEKVEGRVLLVFSFPLRFTQT